MAPNLCLAKAGRLDALIAHIGVFESGFLECFSLFFFLFLALQLLPFQVTLFDNQIQETDHHEPVDGGDAKGSEE